MLLDFRDYGGLVFWVWELLMCGLLLQEGGDGSFVDVGIGIWMAGAWEEKGEGGWEGGREGGREVGGGG